MVDVAYGRRVVSILSRRHRPTERFIYDTKLQTRRDDHWQERHATQAAAVGTALTGAIVVAESGGHLGYDYQKDRRENRGQQGRPSNAVTIRLISKTNHITSNPETV